MFSRILADEALAGGGHLAQSMANRLLQLLPTAGADVAAAAYAGLLSSAYYEGPVPRVTPRAWDLQALFDHLADPAYVNVLKCFGMALRAIHSEALFIPTSPQAKLGLRFAHDSSQEQTPMVLQQISLDDKNLLTEVGPALPENLYVLLGQQRVVSAEVLLEITAQQFGLPLKLLNIGGAELQDTFTLPDVLGFTSSADTQTAAEAADVPSDAELEEIPDEQLIVQTEDQLDAASFLDDDPDE